jgi:hypothetical protein
MSSIGHTPWAIDLPIIVQHTRLGSRRAENAVMSTIAYASPG